MNITSMTYLFRLKIKIIKLFIFDSKMITNINIYNFAELIFAQVTDSKVWYRLAQVSTKFNQVSKLKLIKQEGQIRGYEMMWTELPDGKKHGLFKSWHPSGQIETENNYLHGKLHGTCKKWYPNKQIELKNNYLHGKFHGTCKKWYPNGQIEYEHNHLHNGFHGTCKKWYSCGQIEYEYHYLNGTRHGMNKQWNSDGQIKIKRNYLNGTLHGIQKKWTQNKSLLHSDAWTDVRGINLCKGLTKNDYSWCEDNYVNDIRNGTSMAWYSTGKQMYCCNYLNNQKHGEYKWWDQSGQLVIDEYYTNDKLVQIENKNN